MKSNAIKIVTIKLRIRPFLNNSHILHNPYSRKSIDLGPTLALEISTPRNILPGSLNEYSSDILSAKKSWMLDHKMGKNFKSPLMV